MTNASPSVPTGNQERWEALDVLRGFALFGILVMNIQLFAMISAAYVNPTLAGPMEGLDQFVWLISHVLFDGKFIALFTIMFGASILLLSDRMERSGRPARPLLLRRMAWLGAFGLVHAYLVWPGDILFVYALAGAVVLFLRHMRVRSQLVLACVLFAIPSLIGAALTYGMQVMPAEELIALERDVWDPSAAAVAAQTEAYRGGWLAQMAARVPDALTFHTWVIWTEELWQAMALMLAGMAAYRSGMLTGQWSARAYMQLIAVGLLLGLPVVLLGVQQNEAAGWEMTYSLYLGRMFNTWAAPVVAAAWLGAVMLIVKSGALPRVREALARVGRMALSNYILQSLICTAVFYGHGLGLFGQVGRPGQILVVLMVWAVMPIWSTLWLRHFTMGPLEWTWRCLTYGRRQPLRRAPQTQAA